MIKDIIEKNENTNFNQKFNDILKQYFPSCFNKEGYFDSLKFDKLLKDNGVNIDKEGYELNFLGKSYAKLLTALETETIIKPDLNHNSQKENINSNHIYISGDNLDAIKHLLKSYVGKIKCIYIDPPYNTGKDDFVYMDNFNFTAEQLVEKLGVPKEEAERVISMTSKGSASHSAWLTFIYPRLYLARDLLADDGVIFISIDDNEQANLKLVCDEVFGDENFIGNVVWKNATDNNPTNIACEHEYILFYSKNRVELNGVWKSKVSDIKNLLVDVGQNLLNKYGNTDALRKNYNEWYRENKNQLGPLDRYKYIDEGGVYTGSQSVHNPGREGYRYDVIHPTTNKPCKQPLMGYRFPEHTMQDLLERGKVLFGEDENKIIELKVYAHEYQEKLSSVFDLDGRLGVYDLKVLFNENIKVFSNPKPVKLIQRLISFFTDNNDVILDFFAGSSTTAEAVLKLNSEDDNKRRYIMVQLSENLDDKLKGTSASKKSIIKNTIKFLDSIKKPHLLSEIGIERIKRAGKKIQEESDRDMDMDYGFKIFNVIAPKEETLDKILKFDSKRLFEAKSLLTEFGIETVICTWIVQDGYGFNGQIKEISFSDYLAYQCENTLYLINPDITSQAIKELIEKYQNDNNFSPNRIVLFGYSFNFTKLSELKDNLKQLADHRKIDILTRY